MIPPGVKVSASMMCADMGRLAEEIRQLEQLGVSMLHWDIMDTHFVQNMPCGLLLLQQMRFQTSLPFDVHLMVENNDFFVGEVAKIGVQMISIHHEATRRCDRTLAMIREAGAMAGLALNPSTPLGVLEYVTDLLDYVLIMTVNPGFAGQKLTTSGHRKIADCRVWLASRALEIPIEVDGNVSFEHIPSMIAHGADILVAGSSSLFAAEASQKVNMSKIAASILSGLHMQTDAATVRAPN
jgi:ribulose-phosphate 3-epimerase